TIYYRRGAMVAGVAALAAIWCAVLPPITQNPLYHSFADGRTFHGMPNFWNVISNIPFFIVALCGIKTLRSGMAFVEPWERVAYCVLLAGTAVTGAGSIYYHLQPDNPRLFWDRLPMTVVFMSLVATTIGERVRMDAGRRLLFPLVLLGLGSVLYWRFCGDLRPYGLVQFGSLLAVPALLAVFPPRYSAGRRVWCTVILYLLAKIAEFLDHEIASVVATGGHPWKPFAAAGAVFFYVSAVGCRRPLQAPPAPPGRPPFPGALVRQGASQ
ncbi:MAG: ceramidase domain-containing protein, partial [Candidatus Solibacter sp.]|nr:ceramidase domain-containing protein [Candidatus Solibacter sp.]